MSAAEMTGPVVSVGGLALPGALLEAIGSGRGSLGADMPIALDYRLSRDEPRVVYLGDGGWREIAPDFPTLVQRLGL